MNRFENFPNIFQLKVWWNLAEEDNTSQPVSPGFAYSDLELPDISGSLSVETVDRVKFHGTFLVTARPFGSKEEANMIQFRAFRRLSLPVP